MKYMQLRRLPDAKFRRLTGVKRATFDEMAKILTDADKVKKAQRRKKTSSA